MQAPETRSVTGRVVVGELVRTWLPVTENWIEAQLSVLEAFRPIVLARRVSSPQPVARYPLYRFSAGTLPSRLRDRAGQRLLGYPPSFADACRSEGVRLLHAHGGLVGRRSVRLARALRLPLVTSFYGVDMWREPASGVTGLRRRYSRLFRDGTAFLVEGPAAAARLVEIGCPEERVEIHPLGIDLTDLQVRSAYPAVDAPVRVLMAARFAPKKGLLDGLEAFCRAAARESRLQLTIIGGATSPDEKEVESALHGAVQRHGTEARVRFLGFLPHGELRSELLEHDILLHPSRRAPNGDAEGGHPVIMTEAAATGMPIVATRHCDIPQVVVDGVTGWLVEEGDVDGLEAALAAAGTPAARLDLLGAAARRHVEERYDLHRRTLDPIYSRLCAGATAA